MSGTIDAQEFGRLQAQVEQLLEADKAKTALLERLFQNVDAIRQQLSEARGGWRMLMFLGGGSGAVGAGLGAWLTHLVKGPLS